MSDEAELYLQRAENELASIVRYGKTDVLQSLKEDPNGPRLDLREELTKNETARVDLIEEFLKREDVVLGEVKRAVKIMAEASTPPLPKESLPRRENEGRRRSPSARSRSGRSWWPWGA